MSETKCYTFYSYKGGSGRSTATINTLKHLIKELNVSKENPVLLIDADLESAGLTYFFGLDKKFTNDFFESIHTTKILANAEKILETEGDLIFGKDEDIMLFLNTTDLKRLKTLYPNYEKEIDSVFEDFRIPAFAVNMLKGIIEIHHKYESEEFGYKSLLVSERSLLTYDLPQMIDELVSVQKNNSQNEREKKLRKREIICSYLPATRFVDISKQFDCDEGFVKFLGADVKYQGEQVLRNAAMDSLEALIDYCSEQNYSAVIFDSGAGVQSTAHSLNIVSDVLVYCMRPTLQFIDGTYMQLFNYRDELNVKTDSKKKVILLPTAVSNSEANDLLRKKNFQKIEEMCDEFSDFVDNSFCSHENSLPEVELFKWNEMILGVKNMSLFDNETREIIAPYTDEETMPEDAKKAYKIYASLAERISQNS